WALFAIGMGWILVIVLLLALTGHAPTNSQGAAQWPLVGPGDVAAQLILAIISVGPILFVMHRRREYPASAGISAQNLWRSLAVSALIISAAGVWYCFVNRRSGAGASCHASGLWALMQLAIVGFTEEFAYRGYLQTRLIGWLGSYQGWILASVLMAMAHVGHRVGIEGMAAGEALLSAAALIPISLFLGFVMLRTQNIVAPGLLHMFVNWLDI
ncbi:MAG: CPBP family intramembrane metalloprotease, partial [Candidatus Eisenbacteria bacterium]|nr:CPBP family intramembrane metalloprotease [Candidatus Eisenbacteria bacterium]